MSGPCIHYLIARELESRFRAEPSLSLGTRSFADVLGSHPAHAAVGAQGPDFLFFLVSDIVGTVGGPAANALTGRLAKMVIETSAAIEDLNSHLLEAHPVLEDIIHAKEALDQAIDGTIERSRALSALQDGASAIDQLLTLMSGTLVTGIKATVADTIDVFSFLSHPMQVCEPLDHWWWFDVLHYRKSGEYPTALLKRAQESQNEELLAYAIGYVSHYAADTVGHPYVNTIVRGPYRFHGQRHKVVENSQDVWAWERFGDRLPRNNAAVNVDGYLKERFGTVQGPLQRARMDDGELATSQLHLEYRFEPGGNGEGRAPLPEELELLPTLDPTVELPAAVARGINETLHEVYGGERAPDGSYPRIPEPEEIQVAYRLWYSWFRGSTSNGVLPRALGGHVPLTNELTDAVRDIIEQAGAAVKGAVEALGEAADAALEAVGSLFERLGRGFNGDFDFSWDAFIDLLEELGKAIVDAFAEAVALIDEVLGSLVEIGVSVLKTVLNIAYQKLYGVYLHFRKLLAASGLAFPTRSMLTERRFKHMTSPGNHPDAAGRHVSDPSVHNAYPALTLPRAEFELSLFGEQLASGDLSFMKAESHLIYPPEQNPAAVEKPDRNANEPTAAVIPGPGVYTQREANFYMWDAKQPDASTLDMLFDIGEALRKSEGVDREILTQWKRLNLLADELEQNPLLGNATDLTVELVRRAVNESTLPNLNLDGDRGMAFPSWLMPSSWYEQVAAGQTPDPRDVATVNITPDAKLGTA